MSYPIYSNADNVVMSATDSFDIACHDGSTKGLKLGSELLLSTRVEVDRNCKVNQRIVSLLTGALVLSQATHDSRVIVINVASGSALTLPTATGSGTRFTLIVGTTVTSNNITVTTAAGDYFAGMIAAEGTSNSTLTFVANGSSTSVITLDGDTKGGYIGDRIELIDIASHVWAVEGKVQTSGSQATCFS